MYKDVKKKLLAVLLCICMVIGVVEIIPRVRAADGDPDYVAPKDENGYYTIEVSVPGSGAKKNVKVKLKDNVTEFPYQGIAYVPNVDFELAEVRNAEGDSTTNLADQFKLTLSRGDALNAGDFYCKLDASDISTEGYTGSANALISFKIVPVQLTAIRNVIPEKKVLKHAIGVAPTITQMDAEAKIGNTTITVKITQPDKDQYRAVRADGGTGAARDVTYNVYLAGNAAKNFTGADSICGTVSCDVAYDLATSMNLNIPNGEITYTGKTLKSDVKMILTEGQTTPLEIAAEGRTGLQFSFSPDESVTQTGNYTVTATPQNGEDDIVVFNDVPYTGIFEGRFTVTGRTAENVEIRAKNEKGAWVNLREGNYSVHISKKNNAGEVLPVDMQVIINGDTTHPLDESQYEILFTDDIRPTKIGQYTMTVRLKPSTNYTGDYSVSYYVYEGLRIESISLTYGNWSTSTNADPLPYTGEAYKVENLVVADGDTTLRKDLHYKIDYQYELAGRWVSASPAGIYNASGMETAGNKRIVIKGVDGSAYSGQEVPWQYSIAPADISEATLTITNPTPYYTGEQVVPEHTVVYGDLTLKEGVHYTTESDIDAGSAVLTIHGIGSFSGTISDTFEILPLEISKAKLVDRSGAEISEYAFTGNAPDLQFKINNYYLKSEDYEIVEYIDTTNDRSLGTTAPSNAGSYRVEIRSITGNITNDGKKVFDYVITPKNITGAGIMLANGGVVEWNGSTTTGTEIGLITSLEEGTDYTIAFTDNIGPTAGNTAVATITGIGNYVGDMQLHYTIVCRNIGNADISVSPDVIYKSPDDKTPDYSVKLNVRDDGSAVDKKNLEIGTDYTVTDIRYWDGSDETEPQIWPSLETSDYTMDSVNNAITGLKKAGIYRVTIEGINNYTGTRGAISKDAITFTCGTDISSYIVYIKGRTVFPYSGSRQTPPETPDGFEIWTARNEETNMVCGADFSIVYERADGDYAQEDEWNKNMRVTQPGKIYVMALGEPTRGYYGKTAKVSEEQEGTENGKRRFYTISAPTSADWEKNLNIYVEEGMIYDPNRVDKPALSVSYGAVSLDANRDYEDPFVPFPGDFLTAGRHYIVIEGAGNYVGLRKGVYYNVSPAAIRDAQTTKEKITYNEVNDPNFDLGLEYHTHALVRGTDYVVTKAEPMTTGGQNLYVYTIEGKGNYEGECTISFTVDKINLEEVTYAESKLAAKVGEYYIEWTNDSKFILPPTTTVIAPVKIEAGDFEIGYMTKTGAVPLTVTTDYTINEKQGNNNQLGLSDWNAVTIKGQGGYTGEPTFNFSLCTDITTAVPTSGSVIQKNGRITKPQWKKLYEESTAATPEEKAAALLELQNELGILGSGEYELVWPEGFVFDNPRAGTQYTLKVRGKEDAAPRYYTGTIEIPFTIVDGIENAAITINGNDEVPYQGADKPISVTSSALNLTVKDEYGVTLTLGVDYDVESCTNTNQIGPSTITLVGKGKYDGKATHDFRITGDASQLIIRVWDPVKREYTRDRVSYPYTGQPVRPSIEVYCSLDVPEDADSGYDFTNAKPIPNNLYNNEIVYKNNTNVGEASLTIENCPYITGRVPDVFFSIDAGKMGNVTIKSNKYTDLENIEVEYGGKKFTVDDFDFQLFDGPTKELKEGTDYVVDYSGEMTNVTTDPEKQPTIIYKGIRNYEGSERRVSFSIVRKSIGDDAVTPNDMILTYTDSPSEQTMIDQMSLTFQTVDNKFRDLAHGKDYTIEGYYTDSTCVIPVGPATGVETTDGEGNRFYIPSAPGTYYIKVNGIGNFKDDCHVKLTIEQRNLANDVRITFESSADCPVVDSEPNCTYNGKEHKPTIRVTYGSDNRLLQAERGDYTVEYSDNTNAGVNKATVKVTLGGNYSGSATRTFTIKPKDIRQVEGGTIVYPDIPESYRYTGTRQRPEIEIRDIEIADQSRQLLTGSEQLDIESSEIDYTIEFKPESIKEETEDIAKGIIKEHCTYGGKVVIEIVGKNNYTGTQQFVYYIGENIGEAYVEVNGSKALSTPYNGLMQLIADSAIEVKTNSSGVTLNLPDGTKRYGYAYYKGDLNTRVDESEVVNAGTYYIAVTGNPRLGTYAKSTIENSCRYEITPRSIAQSYILVSGYDASYYYTGQPIEPKAIVVEDTALPVTSSAVSSQSRSVKLVKGADYELSYSNNMYAGKASIRVEGKGNYTGTRDAYFNIVSTDTTGNNTWDGTSEGTGSLTNGTTTISASDIKLGFDNSANNCMMYNGYEQIPSVSINGVNRNEFTVTAVNNVAPGVATLIITGNGGDYTGTIYKNYAIKADLSQYGVISGIADQVYSGYQITPSITLTCGGNILNQGSDYTVTYANNVNVGRATVMAHATSSSYYIGTATGGFNISNGANGMQVTGYASAYTYTGYAITPDVVVTMNDRVLNRGTDYTVSYANNINVGTATMTVTGIGSYSGSRTINFTIEAKNIENCLTTEVNNYQYNGSTYTPVVTVTDSSTGKTLVAGTDYTITYSNNTNPGTAQITVTALSENYTGTKVIPFKITSAAVSGLRTSTIKNNSIKLAWSSQEYADGYQICNTKNRVIATTKKNSYTVKGLTSYTTYKFKVRSYVENADGTVSYGNFSTAVSAKTLLNTPKLTAKSSSKGTVTLTWTKISKASGYEIYYSTTKNGVYSKLKTVSKSSKRRYVDKGLASGEKYYYTIRAYRTANGVKTYSNYNTIKAVKVK